VLTQVQDHKTSDIQDYVCRHPADYPERLWPDEESSAGALMAVTGPRPNIDPAIIEPPAQANIFQQEGRDSNTSLLAVALIEGPEAPSQEPDACRIASLGETNSSASTGESNIAYQRVPPGGPSFVEEMELEEDKPTGLDQLLSTSDGPQNLSLLPILRHDMAQEDNNRIFNEYTNIYSNSSENYFSQGLPEGSFTEMTLLSLDSNGDDEYFQGVQKLCFCKETSNTQDPHYRCYNMERCHCEHCMGWKLWSDQGKEIYNRIVHQ
jgi:hypothetical protein